MEPANQQVCIYLNLTYLRHKFGMKFQLGGAIFGMKFCLSGREFKAILSKFIEINADTIKFYKEQISILMVNFTAYKSLGGEYYFKARRWLVAEIYAMFYIDRGCKILARACAITAKFLSACRFLRARKARPYRH